MKQKAGPSVAPGTFPLEGDLAESWTQPNDTTYIFKLRRGVRWHNKPPVNGRELTAEDVKYSLERFMTVKGNSNAYMLKSVDKVEAVDKYTVKITTKEPFAWLLDMLASPMAVAIVAKEVVEKFGDLKKAEAVIGTGPWMLDSYRPNQGLTFVRNPTYFLPGQPYIDRVEVTVDEDNASRIAAFLSGKYDLGWENPGIINRTDWVQIKDKLKSTRPNLQTAEFPANVMSHISMRTDQKPFSDVRVRQAMSLAIDRQGILDATAEGVGVFNPAVPAGPQGLVDPHRASSARAPSTTSTTRPRPSGCWPRPAIRKGFPGTMCFTTYGSTVLVDSMQLVLKNLKDVGIDAKLDQKEYGAYIASCFNGNFPSMTYGPQTPFLDPDNFLLRPVLPGRAEEPEPHQRPRGGRHARPPAPDLRRGQAPRDHLRDPALPGQAAVLRADPVRRIRRGLGRRPQELRPQPRLRLRRPPDGRLARSLSPRGPLIAGRPQWRGAWRERAASRSLPPGVIRMLRRYLVKRLFVADPLAPDRLAHRVHPAPAHPGRRGAAHARGEGLRQGPRRAAREARAESPALHPVLRVGGPRPARGPRRVALDQAAGASRRSGADCPSPSSWPCMAIVIALAHRDSGGRHLRHAPGHRARLRGAERGHPRAVRPGLLAGHPYSSCCPRSGGAGGPSPGFTEFSKDPWGHIGQLLLPALILGIASAAALMRLTRGMLLEVLRQDYVRTAWAKGLGEGIIVAKHSLRNAIIPVVTLLGTQLPQIIGGTVIIETIFGLPGMSRFLFDAINQRDYPVIQGVNLWSWSRPSSS